MRVPVRPTLCRVGHHITVTVPCTVYIFRAVQMWTSLAIFINFVFYFFFVGTCGEQTSNLTAVRVTGIRFIFLSGESGPRTIPRAGRARGASTRIQVPAPCVFFARSEKK